MSPHVRDPYRRISVIILLAVRVRVPRYSRVLRYLLFLRNMKLNGTRTAVRRYNLSHISGPESEGPSEERCAKKANIVR